MLVTTICFAQTVTLQAEGVSLVKAMQDIQQQTGRSFFLKGKELANLLIDAQINKLELEEAMDELLKKSAANWTLKGGTIVIKPFKGTKSTISVKDEIRERSERRIIGGKITNNMGEALQGVTISTKGYPITTFTDVTGQYNIFVPSEANMLVFSNVGFKKQEKNIEERSVLDIVLIPQIDNISDVVVIGFGRQRQISVIGSISNVSPEKLKMPVGNLSTSLAGQMAGIVTAQRNGEPGASADFWIRGVSTLGSGNRPLVLIDGVERSLDLVNQEDIESVSILKDATATAVYGVRGANGVILITTKQGELGRPIVALRAESGRLSPTLMPKMADAEQYLTLFNDGYQSQFGTPFYSPEDINKYVNHSDPDLYPNVDWMSEIFKRSTTNRRITTNVSGGEGGIRYYLSGSYYQEDGIYKAKKNANYNPEIKWDRYNFRANVDMNLVKGNTISIKLSNQFDIKNGPSNNTIWNYTFQTPPTASPIRFSNGELAVPREAGVNPHELLNERGDVRRFTNNNQSLINITQDFSDYLLNGLQFNLKFSWDAASVTTNTRSKIPMAYSSAGRDENGELILIPRGNPQDFLTLTNSNIGERMIYLESSITYETELSKSHQVSGLILFNRRERFDNFPSTIIRSFPYRTIGLAGRATYSFKDRYFSEFNFGYNGSENFSPNKRFGFFPSIAVGYVISNERFWKSVDDVINIFKLKASYGLIGNDQIGGRRFAYNSEMIQSAGYVFGEVGSQSLMGINVGYQGNPNVSWETAYKTNVGLEVEFFKALNIKADYFEEKRKGIFIQRLSVPTIVGLTVDPFINMGEVANKGFDLTTEYNKSFGEMWISGRGNFTFNRNEIIYNDKPTPLFPYLSTMGKALYQQFGLVANGFFESEKEIENSPEQLFGNVRVGDVKYKDINGDGQVDENDQIAIGRTHVPEISYGMGLSIGLKNIDFSFFFQGVNNVTNFMGGSAIYGFSEGNSSTGGVYEDVALNRWTPENANAKYPRISVSPNLNNNRNSTLRSYDASFMRLKNLEMGYTFSLSGTKQHFLKRCRLYMQGVNLVTFSKFKLWDPEIIDSQGSVYPNLQTLSIGVNVSF